MADELTDLQQAMVEHDDDMARLDRNTLNEERDRPYLSASQRSEALAEIQACDKCDLCEDHHQ